MRAFPSLLLVACTVALALGLTAIAAGLAPVAGDPDAPGRERVVAITLVAPSPDAVSREWGEGRAPASIFAAEPESAPSPAALSRFSPAGPWKSPLYPRNDVTLWDRIRTSSPRDRDAYLQGIGIQVHAPATAATPGPRSFRWGVPGEA